MRISLRHRAVAVSAAVAAASLLLAGCTAAPAPSAAHRTVTVVGSLTGSQATQLQAAWSPWTKLNGVTIDYVDAAKAGMDAHADIELFSTPGGLAAAVDAGKVVPVDAATAANLSRDLTPDWQSTVASGGRFYGVPIDASLDGYVWYSPSRFAAWKVKPPTTYAELLALTKTIRTATGQAPWCAGFSAGADSGWPGADQLAETLLATGGAHGYDDWLAGRTPSTDRSVDAAFDALGAILRDPASVNAGYGDAASINRTAPDDTATKLVDGSCALTNQPLQLETTLAATHTPGGKPPTIGEHGDIWAFPLPGASASATTLVGTVSVAGARDDDPATAKVMTYLSSPAFADSLLSLRGSGFVTPNTKADPTREKDPLLAAAVATIHDKDTTFRLNPDNVLPPAVETALRAGMIDWVNGVPQQTVEQRIQSAWPKK